MKISWEKVERLGKTTIFLPAFAAPVSIRECIAEEIIQALGPGNDLYGLEDSLFNDDDAHVWPTAFDLKILNILYSDNLVPGMSRKEALEAAKVALAQTPEGKKKREWTSTSRLYHTEYHRSLTSEEDTVRETALERASNFSKQLPKNDHRRGEVLRRQAIIAKNDDNIEKAIALSEEAISIFRLGLPKDSPRLARLLSNYAFYLYLDDQYEEALTVLEEAQPVLAAHALESEFAFGLLLKAFAHLRSDNWVDAKSAARETIAWARYVYGADSEKVRDWTALFRKNDLNL